MTVIRNRIFSSERDLYNAEDLLLEDCRVEGEEDGESFLKESRSITLKRCRLDLRYPLWHCRDILLEDAVMTEHCRAALWYSENVRIVRSALSGIKAVRECRNVSLETVTAASPEFCWRSRDVALRGVDVVSEYAFLASCNMHAEALTLTGKYSFQYTENVTVEGSKLTTKDAFWHAKNVTVRDSVIDGEYLGWYSDGLTLERCRIRGTQPFCYCKNLRLVDCELTDCDLAFEYSEVEASVRGKIASVKNPRSGTIVADGYGEIILTGAKYPCTAVILVRKEGEPLTLFGKKSG